jgi:menaquinone-dependent protoporphyrinogen oxidase
MKILVSAASRHGSTTEIAQAIGEALTSAGIEADVRKPEDVSTVAPYDGVIIGSGVYAGRWLGPAKALIERDAAALSSRPVWLFSSGPLGDDTKPAYDPKQVAEMVEKTHAVEHRQFAGKVDRRQLGIAERAIFAVVRVPDGDFRQWAAIRNWASEIAVAMRARM